MTPSCAVRRVVGALCALQARVELLDLAHDLLRLGLLRADGGVAGGCAGRDESRSNDEDEHRRLSLQNPDNGLPRITCDKRTGGVRYVTSSAG